MTNEEKASYIARELVNMGVKGKFDIANKAAMEMAEWKDEQYKIKINELINFIKGHCFESVFRNTLVIEEFDNVDDFINKIEKIK